MTLDLLGDDQESIQAKRNVMKWDRRKKKFVMAPLGLDINSKKVKNEAGKKVTKKKEEKRGEL